MCAVLKVVIEAATELIKDDVGEMMCEPEFLDWCKTPKGGLLDTTSAKLKWDEMLLNRESLKLVTDEKGPGRFKTRIRVSVKDLVIFRERLTQARTAEFSGQQIKKPKT